MPNLQYLLLPSCNRGIVCTAPAWNWLSASENEVSSNIIRAEKRQLVSAPRNKIICSMMQLIFLLILACVVRNWVSIWVLLIVSSMPDQKGCNFNLHIFRKNPFAYDFQGLEYSVMSTGNKLPSTSASGHQVQDMKRWKSQSLRSFVLDCISC